MPHKSPENPGNVAQEKFWKRALWGLPLFGLMCAGAGTVGATMLHIRPHMEALLEHGVWTASSGETFNVHEPIYNGRFLDEIFRPVILCFMPSITGAHAQSWTQMFSFIPEFGAVYAIWLLEGYRKDHSWRGLLFPIIIGQAAQLLSVAVFGPLYYLLQYIFNPLHKTVQSNNREIKPTSTYTLLAALAAAHYIPSYASFLAPDLKDRQLWNAAWQIFPLTVPLLQLPLSLFFQTTLPTNPNPNQDPAVGSITSRTQDKQNSLAAVRVVYSSLALISAVGFVYARTTVPAESSMLEIFWPGLDGYVLSGDVSFEEGLARFLQYDQISSMAAGFVWLWLRMRELKMFGAGVSWFRAVVGLVGVTWVFGPGTAFVLGWGWKEEVLHKLGS
ncbi:Monooxygenase FAD-binding [Penicillium verhagenii]|uniref:Monooxygenase FAD-binding n=1 Tax=Penicillium verhagenii TaxID=1562060 RepID=UPI002545433D|nr:Monooxygenase FAD-binding [Penicillium verhagenii]KAJ5919266.1 Monooxygenase FAD-binding [Penicillium verhagenii]